MVSMCSIISLLFLGLLLFFQVSIAQFSFDGSPLQSSRSFRGRRESWQRCHFEHLTALEPTHQARSEAGFTEYYNTEERDEFQCAGLNVKHLIVESMGFVLPMYDNAHKLVYIIQGHGVYGMALPGCPETFQSVRSPLEQRMAALGEGQSTRKMWDEHQQLHQFRQGDVIAVPAGVAHWLYNNGDSAMVAFIVIDTNNNANQLNPRRREFILAGKPRISQQYLYKAEQQSTQNIFAGFSQGLLAEALGVSRHVAMRLQSRNDQRGIIVRVDRGLRALQPSFIGEPILQEQYEEYLPTEQAWMTSTQYSDAWRQQNGLDEMCTFKVIKNINNPQAADIFSTRGGTITRVNSQNFPILHIIQMSATRTVLQNALSIACLFIHSQRLRNNILTPHWTMNAHTVMYVTAGEARVQVVDHHGRSVYDGQLHQQQILLIPQNFVVVVNALSQGFTWVSFKTNPNAIDSQISGKASVLGALPVDVLANSYKLSREESRCLKFNRGDEMAIFVPRHGM